MKRCDILHTVFINELKELESGKRHRKLQQTNNFQYGDAVKTFKLIKFPVYQLSAGHICFILFNYSC